MNGTIAGHIPDRRSGIVVAIIVFTALALFLAGTGQGHALNGPEKYASQVGNQAVKTARAGGSKERLNSGFRSMLRRYSSIRSVAPQLLGKYRRKLPSSKAAEYKRLVEGFTARLFTRYADQFAGNKMQVEGSRKRGSRYVVVETKVVYAGNTKSSPIKWLVSGSGGGYRILDIQVYGVWLSAHMRNEFTKVLRANKGDFNALFAYLKK